MRGVNLLAAVLQQNRYGRKVAYTASILLFTLSACTVFPLSFDGSGAQATSGFSVPATPVITLSTTNNTATVDIVINNALGVFASSTTEGTASFDVTTDNATGYTLSIVADDNAGLLSDDSGTETHTIASISDKLAESAFNNSAYNNKWGYKPNKYYDTTNNQTVTNTGSGAVYLPSPTTVATTLDKTSAANAEGNEYTIALGVRADYGTVDGTYTNTFNLIATGNPVPYIIAYNKNTNDTVTNMPITQSSSTNADYVALASETPARSGYIFLGWCPSQPTNNNGIDICSGTVYQPGDDYGLDHTTTTNDTLYAMWQSGTTRTYLQDITPESCPSQPTVVFDTRDGEPYTIQKLADGNCWMLDNLRLGNGSTTVALTPADTNITSNFTLPASVNQDFNDYTQPQINTDYETRSAFYGVTGEGKVGTYYNFCAATAGTYCAPIGESTGSPTEDICPKGWRLPTGGETGEYQTLYAAYADYAEFKNALRSPLSGYFKYAEVNHIGSYGSFWSSTPVGDDRMYSLDVRLASVPSDFTSYRTAGISIRCVKADTAIKRVVMQEIDNWRDTLAINESAIATDNRDGKEYWVTRLLTDSTIPDGRADCTGEGANRVCTQIWMTQNLDLDLAAGTKTYTHADTDLGWSNGDTNVVWTPQVATVTVSSQFQNTTITEKSYDLGSDTYYYTSGSTSNDRSYTLAQCVAAGYSENDCKHYHSGNLYNYYAATALGATSGGSSIEVSTSRYSEMPNSICPAGWRLPTGLTASNGYSDFDYLFYRNSVTAAHTGGNSAGYATHLYGDSGTSTNGFNNIRIQPLWFVRAGYIGGDLDGQTRYGSYWSSTIYSDSFAYLLNFQSDGDIYPANNSHRQFGYSVRCVARPAEPEPPTMQEITLETCPTTPTTVIDSRDGEEYQIQKLADGNCWLLDNLRLDLTDVNVQANLTSNTTNASDTTLNYLKNGGGTASDKYAMIGATNEWIYNQYDYSSPRINLDYKDTTGSIGYVAGKYGAYYSYCAASAGSYCYGDATTGYGTPVGNAEEDICPKGWHLPTGTGSDGYGEYAELYILLNNDATTFINALHLPVSGGYGGASSPSTGEGWYEPYHQNLFGNYWTSTRLKNNVPRYMVTMQMSTRGPTSELTESAGNSRSHGMSVRCVMGSPKYSISYDSNNADAGTMTNVHRNLKSGDSVPLIASNFSRSGYGFAGWSTDSAAATKVTNNQAVTIYGPNQVITTDDAFLANADSNNNIKLYAVWLPQDTTKTMQTFTTSECTAMAAGSVIALKDTRDDEVYTVAKLGDGHCWMTENLRINPATANITASNTNGPTQAFLDGLATAADSTTLCNTNGSACDDTIQYNLNNLNRNLTATPSAEDNSSSWYAYGGMYNWFTATAGNGLYSQTSGSVTGDICPTGWRLPTGGNSGEYKALNAAINGNKTTLDTGLVSFPANFVYSGDYNHDTSGGRGRYARLWSATATSNANAYRMGVASTEVTPLKNWNKWDGFAVRCIAK